MFVHVLDWICERDGACTDVDPLHYLLRLYSPITHAPICRVMSSTHTPCPPLPTARAALDEVATAHIPASVFRTSLDGVLARELALSKVRS